VTPLIAVCLLACHAHTVQPNLANQFNWEF
jgi:hypothetical protein